MSRLHTTGTHPQSGDPVEVCYGWDEVPGFTPGYFFQAFSHDKEDIDSDPTGQGIIVDEGFLEGISKERLEELGRLYSVDIDYSKI
jgi:hypothetical protein